MYSEVGAVLGLIGLATIVRRVRAALAVDALLATVRPLCRRAQGYDWNSPPFTGFDEADHVLSGGIV